MAAVVEPEAAEVADMEIQVRRPVLERLILEAAEVAPEE